MEQSAMTWEQFAMLWGPAIPVFAVMVHFLDKLVIQVIPKGFAALAKSVDKLGDRYQAAEAERDEVQQEIAEHLSEILNHLRNPPAKDGG